MTRDLGRRLGLWSDGVPWGSCLVLDAVRQQCLAAKEVERARVLHQHEDLDEDAASSAFLASPFGAHVTRSDWPSSSWNAVRVQAALHSMREGAAPGLMGVTIAVWRSLPSPWPEAVARLHKLVEAERCWPTVLLDTYVAMIPNSAGGTRPQDQRPITVLEVLYRVGAKGIVTSWSPTV